MGPLISELCNLQIQTREPTNETQSREETHASSFSTTWLKGEHLWGQENIPHPRCHTEFPDLWLCDAAVQQKDFEDVTKG